MTLEQRIIRETEKKKRMTFRKWWNQNDYKVMRVIFWPIWLYQVLIEKHKDKSYKALTFSKETCKKYLDKVMPKMVACYNNDHSEILISNADGMGDIQFSYFGECKNKKMSRFFRKFRAELKQYILEEYTIDGYEKMVIDNWTVWEKAANMFDWWGKPYNSDDAKGALFYKEEAIKNNNV